MRACDPSLTLQHQVGSVEGSGDPASPASPENRSGYGQGHPWAGGGGQWLSRAGASVAAATHLCWAPLGSRDTLSSWEQLGKRSRCPGRRGGCRNLTSTFCLHFSRPLCKLVNGTEEFGSSSENVAASFSSIFMK